MKARVMTRMVRTRVLLLPLLMALWTRKREALRFLGICAAAHYIPRQNKDEEDEAIQSTALDARVPVPVVTGSRPYTGGRPSGRLAS
ncbi:MAG: hypothetical protein KAX25_00285, partial [Dehalococcoidia bacterium]|nr:hypothetical protein [Dehalococcoidia bacterium]